MFVIEDEWHAEHLGRYATFDEALSEVHRVTALRWDEAPLQPPCTSWRGCDRRFLILEFDSPETWTLLSRVAVAEVSAAGVRWLAKDAP